MRVRNGSAQGEEIGKEKGENKETDNYKRDWEEAKMRSLRIKMSEEGQRKILVEEIQMNFPETKTLSVPVQEDEQRRGSMQTPELKGSNLQS